jgi:hypothetical protein
LARVSSALTSRQLAAARGNGSAPPSTWVITRQRLYDLMERTASRASTVTLESATVPFFELEKSRASAPRNPAIRLTLSGASKRNSTLGRGRPR